MTATDITAGGSSDCPLTEITLSGTGTDDYADLATEITDYSDGAMISVQWTFSGDYWTTMETET